MLGLWNVLLEKKYIYIKKDKGNGVTGNGVTSGVVPCTITKTSTLNMFIKFVATSLGTSSHVM